MATGAWLLIAFLATRMPSTDQLRDVDNYVQLGWWILFIVWCASAPRNSEAYRDLSTARSGTDIVAVCGIAAAMFLSRSADWPEGLIVHGLIMLGYVVFAFFVYHLTFTHTTEY